MNTFQNLQKEDRFGLFVTGGIHIALLVFFLLYTLSLNQNVRPSYINVQFGAFQSGTAAEFAQQVNQEVATSPDPSEVQPEEPQPDTPEPVEEQIVASDETTKPVDAPDQQQDVDAEELKTPETDKIDPNETSNTEQEQELVIPPKAQQDETRQEGAESSGDTEGTEGEMDVDQGSGNEQEKAAPFNLNIEGLSRDPMTQPLPENSAGVEAIISLRFEVTPEGNVVNIIPLRKSGNPAIDQQTMQILSDWQFSQLPANVPQQNQAGTITFNFVVD